MSGVSPIPRPIIPLTMLLAVMLLCLSSELAAMSGFNPKTEVVPGRRPALRFASAFGFKNFSRRSHRDELAGTAVRAPGP